MDILLDPNIAYLLLAGGIFFAVLAILNPGTGLLEIVAVFALLLAGWSIYNLPINLWALGVMFLGAVLFIVAVRRPQQLGYLAVSIAALVLGSAFLFRSETPWVPAVNPFLAATVSILSGGFFWVATRKILEARSILPTHDLKALIGALGEAKSEIHADGSVQVAGELWSARSEHPIPTGSPIRVVERDGFILKVEAIQEDAPQQPDA